MSEVTITYNDVISRANNALKDGKLPGHSVWDVTEVVGAVLGMPKEIIFELMVEANKND